MKRNMIRCLQCGDTIWSKHRHDYVRCCCGAVAVDGGNDYHKRSFPADMSPEQAYEEVGGGDMFDLELPATGKAQTVGQAETSKQAAANVEGIAGKRRVVLDAIRAADWYGATDEEIQRHTGLNPSTERPRRVELVEKGLVHDSGVRRRTRSGRRAVVWRASEYRTGQG